MIGLQQRGVEPMSREDYLGVLYANLRRLPERELASVMKYYEEYFQEAGPDREAALMDELGPPEELACQIAGRGQTGSGHSRPYGQEFHRRKWTPGQRIALICLSPLWISLLVGAVAALVGLVVGVGAGGLGVMAAGVFAGWCGFTAIFSPGITTTMLFGGVGIFMVGLGLAMVAGALALGRVCGKGFAALCRRIFGRGRGYRV